ncbi:MAG: hypothetical protein GEV03_13940 [Streptosporangiales bacterium]|nr:hypothetical protein [Streptosporangiales bacterium]
MRVVDHTALRLITAGAPEGYNLLDLAERHDVLLVVPATALEAVSREAFGHAESLPLLMRIDGALGFDQVTIDALDEHRALQVAEAGSTLGGAVSVSEVPPFAHAAVCAREHGCPVITGDAATWKDAAPDVRTVDIG